MSSDVFVECFILTLNRYFPALKIFWESLTHFRQVLHDWFLYEMQHWGEMGYAETSELQIISSKKYNSKWTKTTKEKHQWTFFKVFFHVNFEKMSAYFFRDWRKISLLLLSKVRRIN